ncbi:MAG TPA: hypothetical protein VM452_09920 [Caulifigura sp.]|nr:hypothetical protein [Caulifigura sp.]
MHARGLAIDRFLGPVVLVLVLAGIGPLFVRSPLGPDPVMYDLQARLVGDGGVLYRDILEPNLPGAVWIHLAVRSVFGWSPEALRLFDLGWFLVAAWFATGLMPFRGSRRWLVIAFMAAGYFTLSEWCHCQRDVWTLPFVLSAVSLRVSRFSAGGSRWNYCVALCEGVLWGCAVWLKPHVVVPAVFVVFATWLASMKGRRVGAMLAQEGFVILGGAVVGMTGVLWLVRHDAWSPLWSILTEWNRDYVASSGNRWSWERLWSIQERLAPWSLLHLVAAPIALWTLGRVFIHARSADARPVDSTALRPCVIAALYFGWLVQSLLLQHLFDYVHVPALILAAMVVATIPTPRLAAEGSIGRVGFAAVVVLAAGFLLQGGRLSEWRRCVSGPATPELRNRLARLPLPEWTQLAQVEQYLRQRGVRDGELTAYHTHTIHLYPALGVTPSTRYVFTETHLRLFSKRAGEIAEALARSGQRFVVSDLLEAGLEASVALDDSDPDNWRTACPGGALDSFPFDQPVVFRAGPYLVHEVTRPMGPVETGFFPLAAKSAGL